MNNKAEQPVNAAKIVQKIDEAISTIIKGKSNVVRLLLTTLFARGHALIEDVPGVGKTTLARALAICLGGTFRRIQFTSDLLPSDILGVSVYNQNTHMFEFKQGPIFANVVLADEINRTAPRTQSSLMEVLNEGQVSVDNQTYKLDDPFIVIATQNPLEHFGTYPLPESELDRFLLRISMGYPTIDVERQVVANRGGFDPFGEMTAVVDGAQICAIQRQVDKIHVDSALLDYVMSVISNTRSSNFLSLGVSPRGAIAWYRAAQAHALVNGRNHCEPDDFKALALSALTHRVVLASQQESVAQTRHEAEKIVGEILEHVEVPL